MPRTAITAGPPPARDPVSALDSLECSGDEKGHDEVNEGNDQPNQGQVPDVPLESCKGCEVFPLEGQVDSPDDGQQRGVFDYGGELVAERREGDPKHLRKDDVAYRLSPG